MPNIRANGIQIEHDGFGDSAAPLFLRIEGFGVRRAETDSSLKTPEKGTGNLGL
jgi:hypothetical protein